jgi:hypothetical protein
MHPLESVLEGLSKQTIAGYSAHKQYRARMQQGLRFSSLRNKRVDDCLLIARHKIAYGQGDFAAGPARFDPGLLDVAQGSRFKSAETEVQAPVADFRYGKHKSARIAAFGQSVDDGPARIAESEKLRQLIQCLSRGVVSGPANRPIFVRRRGIDE